MAADDHLNAEVQGVVEKQPKLVLPYFVVSERINIINQNGRSADQPFLPLGFKSVHGRSIRRRQPQHVTFLSTEQGLSGGMEQMRAACSLGGHHHQRIEAVSWPVDDMLTTSCGVEVLLGHKPLLERGGRRPRHAFGP